MKSIVQHLVQLIAVMCLVGSIHLITILKFNYNVTFLQLFVMYSVNAGLAVFGYLGIRFMYALKTQAEGFAFLLGSFVKFGVLYVLFLDNGFLAVTNPKEVFMHVFVPYVMSLIWEIWVLANILNAPPKTA